MNIIIPENIKFMNNQNLNGQVLNIRYFSLVMFIMMLFTYSCSEQNCMDSSLNAEDTNTKTEELERLLLTKSFDSDAFITEWNIQAGDTVSLPLVEGYEYTFMVDWGDGSGFSMVTSYDSPNAVHVYISRGTFQISILGKCEALSNGNFAWKHKLTKVVQWGKVDFKDFTSIFDGCEGLQSIPGHIPDVVQYFAAFAGCKSLKTIPADLFNSCTKAETLSTIFSGCVSLRTIPQHLFDSCNTVTDFSYAFYDCNMSSVPNDLFANCEMGTYFTGTFMQCTSLQSVPNGLFDVCFYALDFSYAFADCKNLVAIADKLFKYCVLVQDFSFTFSGCRDLAYIPDNLFDDCYDANKFWMTFADCISLRGHTPASDGFELWDRAGKNGYPKTINGSGCFKNCLSLSNYNSIPATWK